MNIKRLFLVGCPRSGTTLLQSMVASHSQVVSFPETHFFSKTLPIHPLLRRLKIHRSKSRDIILQFLNQHNYIITPFANAAPLLSHNQWCQLLLNIIDKMIAHNAPETATDTTIWGLEKTPRHLHYIASIEQNNSKNKFLHILRNGPDVVASLYLATNQYPEQWGGKRSIKKCISWWNSSIRESLKYRQESNHFYVVYEQLLNAPEVVLQKIAHFLDLEYEQAMMNEFHHTAGQLTNDKEQWKDQNANKELQHSNKLGLHFDASTISYIKEQTLDIDLRQFYH